MWQDGIRLQDVAARRTFLRRPVVLRFTTDTFMEEFNAILATEPASLAARRATPEKWWKKPVAPAEPARALALPPRLREKKVSKLRQAARERRASQADPAPSPDPLKLFQPVHQRYYLVAGSLVCRTPGMPDRRVDLARQERVSYVIRRLIPSDCRSAATRDASASDEYALVVDQSGARWSKVVSADRPASDVLVPDEEQLPLFPCGFKNEDGWPRRLFAGLIPVARRDALMAVPSEPKITDSKGIPYAPPPDGRLMLLQTKVKIPWAEMRKLAAATDAQVVTGRIELGKHDPASEPAVHNKIETDIASMQINARSQIQLISWYALLDLADFLAEYARDVWAVLNGSKSREDVDEIDRSVITKLQAIQYREGGISKSLAAALAEIVAPGLREALESESVPYVQGSGEGTWPVLKFPLAALTGDSGKLGIVRSGGFVETLTDADLDDLFEGTIMQGLSDETPPASAPDPPLPARPAVGLEEPWYLIRLVYERPNCGEVRPTAVSDPTEPFQLAGFFDPDAPARPIRIGLPIDTSPAGLRKFDKKTAFLMSDILCGHVKRMRQLTFMDLVLSVLPWPFHQDLPQGDAKPCAKGGDSFGMVCSLSIPIITICALIVLMIMVTLLDYIFRWVPYFIFCFPLPGFKAKARSIS